MAPALLFAGAGTAHAGPVAQLNNEVPFDLDGDGVSNDEERDRGFDPSNPDTDGDGYNDFCVGLTIRVCS